MPPETMASAAYLQDFDCGGVIFCFFLFLFLSWASQASMVSNHYMYNAAPSELHAMARNIQIKSRLFNSQCVSRKEPAGHPAETSHRLGRLSPTI
jgi:hypothetical protein